MSSKTLRARAPARKQRRAAGSRARKASKPRAPRAPRAPREKPLQTVDLEALDDAALFALAWRAGNLSYKLREYQVAVYHQIKAALWGTGDYETGTGPHRRFVLEIHRRFGKSFLCAVIACELCAVRPGARVYWAAETQVQVSRFLLPLLRAVTADCPPDLKPRWVRDEGVLRWPNGSEILISGVEDEAKCDRLRGDGCHLFIVDEAGSLDTLSYLLSSVVLWMLASHGGKLLIPSTPARTPGHPFTNVCVRAESGEGGFAHRDVYQSGFSAELLEELATEVGGMDTAAWKREALALRVVDAERAIIPEFSEDGAYDEIVLPLCVTCGHHYDEHERGAVRCEFVWAVTAPKYRDRYTSTDFGWSPDLTFIAAGYWDFLDTMLVIEGERELSKPTTIDIAGAMVELESELWGTEQPYRRVADVDLQILCDLEALHGITVEATAKDDKDAAINDVRVRTKRRKLRIHPRCKKLIAQLKAGIWDKPKKSSARRTFARLDGFGHFDGIDALVYLHRNIDHTNNPYPSDVLPDAHWRKQARVGTKIPNVPKHFEELATSMARSRDALFSSRSKRKR